MTLESDAIRFQNFTVDEVVDGLADKNAGGEISAEKLVAVRGCAVPRGDVVELGRIVKALKGAADGIAPGGFGIIGQHLPRGFDG